MVVITACYLKVSIDEQGHKISYATPLASIKVGTVMEAFFYFQRHLPRHDLVAWIRDGNIVLVDRDTADPQLLKELTDD